MRWRRGRRVSELAMGYVSDDGVFRVDRVRYGSRVYYRVMVRECGEVWTWFDRRIYRTMEKAKRVCERREVSQCDTVLV